MLAYLREKILEGDLSELLQHSKDEDYPAEVAKLFETLPIEDTVKAFLAFPEKLQLKIFSFLDHVVQGRIMDTLTRVQASYILNNLDSNDRLSFFDSLKAWEVQDYLGYLNDKNKKATFDLMGYPEKSVARLINTNFTAIRKEMTVGEAQEHLRRYHQDSEVANMIYVVDKDGKLVDDIPVRRLVLNDQSKTISDIMDGFYVKLNIKDSIEEAIDRFKEYDRIALPVTNPDNILVGVVTIDDVIDEAEEKDTKDMQQFGGMESLDLPYVKTSFFTLIQKRSGWLIILFLSEMLTATAMTHFQSEINRLTFLSIFVPLIISSGGNSGSQAATLIIRAMALKELSPRNWWYVMRREIMAGLTLGLILGTIGFLRITVWHYSNWDPVTTNGVYHTHWYLVAITIFFSLIGTVMWGTISGAMIPVLLKRLKLDPATSSAPFVATLVDVTGIIIYFTVALSIWKGIL
ncbi:MAG: magnesium transporter [Taibaiella sp.]|nr:magnesium transporter [Taibaiella sp.]